MYLKFLLYFWSYNNPLKITVHTRKTRAPQASNGTDSGLKSRKRITCIKRAFPWNDLD